jgi:hypothetical protein
MPSGRHNKLLGAAGEYLIAAELCRRGLIATTFTGNVPFYDIIASDEGGRHVAVQVKASSRGSWQVSDITSYFEVAFKETQQIIGKPKPCPIKRLVMVFVVVDPKGQDRFYILTWAEFRDILLIHHKEYLAKHNGIRPKKWNSLHAAIKEELLKDYQDNWSQIQNNLG